MGQLGDVLARWKSDRIHDERLIKLWDVESGELVSIFKGHMHAVNCAAFSYDGEQIVSCSADKTIRVWEVVSGKTGSTSRSTASCFPQTGNAFPSLNGSVRLNLTLPFRKAFGIHN